MIVVSDALLKNCVQDYIYEMRIIQQYFSFKINCNSAYLLVIKTPQCNGQWAYRLSMRLKRRKRFLEAYVLLRWALTLESIKLIHLLIGCARS
jgi:hypothetical protein